MLYPGVYADVISKGAGIAVVQTTQKTKSAQGIACGPGGDRS